MVLDLSIGFDREKMKKYTNKLYESQKVVELKEIRPKRTINQNSYLHLILGIFAMETGYSHYEMKIYMKLYIVPALFPIERGKVLGHKVHTIRSTKDLDKSEFAICIDAVMQVAESVGVILPPPVAACENYPHIQWQLSKVERNLIA